MFEVKRSEVLRVRIYGEEFSLRKPSVKMIGDYAVDIEKATTSEQFSRGKALLMGMGLKEELINGMEIDHLTELITFLTSSMEKDSKKN